MAIEVRIPTILRTYTGGAKAVEGSGDTLDELLSNEDVRFLGGLETPVKDGDTVTVLPAVAGGSF
jgi:molybdopterin converting factor small subunit